MKCHLPLHATIFSGHKPSFACIAKPHKMFNCDEEFELPDNFYAKSRIPAPVEDFGNSGLVHTVRGLRSALPGQCVQITVNSSTPANFLSRHWGLPRTIVQRRNFHHDLKAPDFTENRLEPFKNARASTAGGNRRQGVVSNVGALTGGIIAGMLVKGIANTVFNNLQTSKAMKALSVSEFNISAIEPGKTVTELWQSKPVFIHRWTEEELEKERQVNLATLRDPETIEQRCAYPEWLIVVGICTHLGCVPIPGHGDFGGYFCPCHASHYDSCGRIRKGPAPRNLEVPSYYFDEDGILVVGASK